MSDVLTPVRIVRSESPATRLKVTSSAHRARNRAMLLWAVSGLILWLEYCCIMAWGGWFDAYMADTYDASQWLLLLSGAIVLLSLLYWKCWIHAWSHWFDWRKSLSSQ